jgi:S1-C subfamily serine protease
MKIKVIYLVLLLLTAPFAHSQNLDRRGWLGVQFENLPAEEVQNLKLSQAGAVIVIQVIEGSSADVAGVRINDIIVECNGKAITQINDLLAVASQTAVPALNEARADFYFSQTPIMDCC